MLITTLPSARFIEMYHGVRASTIVKQAKLLPVVLGSRVAASSSLGCFASGPAPF